jgi:hypothetical protein
MTLKKAVMAIVAITAVVFAFDKLVDYALEDY